LALSPTPILCFDGDSAGQKAAIRGALRALPHVGPARSLSFVTMPAGQDPDDLIRSGGREAIEALFQAPEPLVDRLWAHEAAAEPTATPEQKAALRKRLVEHAATIADRDVAEGYKHDLLGRYFELVRPPQREWKPQRDWKRPPQRGGRFAPPVRPASDEAKAVGAGSLAPQTARAVLHGLMYHPEVLAEHAEAVAALPLAERTAVRLRDAMLEAALVNAELDPDGLATILRAKGAASEVEGLRRKAGLTFSFTRRDADPERARRDLVLVLETLAARPGLEAALGAATARLKDEGDEAAFQEQQRLRAARDEADRQLAALVEGASDAA
jgi:DNA primase